MGYKSLVEGLVTNAFTIVGDLAEAITYHVQATASYDPATSSNDTGADTDIAIASAVLASYSQKEMEKDENIDGKTDLKCLFALEGLTFTPSTDDKVTAKSAEWDIEEAMGVPGDSLAILRIRRR
jgi:hypothetical protein